MYMGKLANGINPIDDSVVPDEDIVNNVRLSRCFFFVSDVLRQIIEHSGIESEKKAKKLPLEIPYEKEIGLLSQRIRFQPAKLQNG